MTAIRTTPYTTDGAPGFLVTCCAGSGRYWMNAAPTTAPGSQPSPPTASPITRVIEGVTA